VNDPQLSYTGLDLLRALDRAINYNALLVDLILESAGGRQPMLDFGAGVGTFSKLLRSEGADVTCVEPDPYLSDCLVRNGFSTFRDLNEVPDDLFEFVFALNVLEHIADDRAVLRQLGAKLRQTGRLLVYVPAFGLLSTGLDEKIKHHRRYRRKDFGAINALRRAFGSEKRYVDSLGFLAALSFKIVSSKKADLSARAIALYDRYIVPPTRPWISCSVDSLAKTSMSWRARTES
jgi:SAM-dependent methyltransferase